MEEEKKKGDLKPYESASPESGNAKKSMMLKDTFKFDKLAGLGLYPSSQEDSY